MMRNRLRRFEVASELAAGADEVWAHATSPAGVNYEMSPWLHMTFPHGMGNVTEGWVPGRTLFRSWLFVVGVLPLDYDDVAFVAVEPGRRFQERSMLLSQRVWEHERVIEPLAADSPWAPARGCRVTDRLGFEPRIAALGAIYEGIFRQVFAHRHRRLRKRFGQLRGADGRTRRER
jgi:hypothetical protein